MNTTPINTADTAVLDAGTYEIIQQRLQTQTTELRGRLAQLNEMRKTVFGAIETQLVANERIHTQNHCIARDMVAIGNWCVLGYNVHIGLRSGIQLSDVFSSFELEEHSFRAVPLKWEQHEKFVQDFQNLYRYYKNAFFARFVRQEAYLYLVFQISANVSDIKVFKWLVKGDELHYVDNRSEHEIRQVQQHEFDWKRAKRDDQRKGKHPHISILDRVFVETVGGDLTIKVEDNTDDGLGIYRETVEQADQTLDDATFRYADLDNLIALNIRPYQEKDRYFIFNEKIQRVQRIDALADSGILLPDGHGLIFANGYYLQDGEYKIFPTELRNLQFEKRISSPNGEDYLYIFLQQHTGIYVLLSYNVIARQIATPIICHGYTIFSNGLLCYFRAEDEPSKHHLIQIWQTPYLKDSSFPSEHTDNYLYKIGNKDIVKAMAETNSIISLAQKEDVYTDLYEDLVRMTTHLLDSYYWLNRPEAMELHAPVENIRTTAAAAITEYEKKIGIERATNETLRTVQTRATALFDTIRRTTFDLIDQYVTQLADLRSLRGELISAKSLRYADTTSIEQLETTTAAEIAQLSERAVQFLLEEDALLPYQHKITEQREALQTAQIAVVVNELLENITNIGTELEMLIEIVSNLKIEDATQTTRIIDHISVCYAQLNQLKAQARRRRQELKGTESVATFNAQLKLLEQAIVNYLDISDTPTRCDEYLTKLMIQLDELESKFVEFDDFVEKLTDKRTTIYDAFETRKKRLIASFNSRTTALQQSAERILKGIQTRAQHYQELDEINAFFAADLMVDKVRNIIAQLTELKDTNKANSIQTQLKTVQEETIRQLRDRRDLFVDGAQLIQFGQHRFSVNVQPLELTIVERSDALYFHLTGTDFYEAITAEALSVAPEVWKQNFVSENDTVYRAEYLAYLAFKASVGRHEEGEVPPNAETLLPLVQQFAATRYEEGYTKGVHDVDATTLLVALYELESKIGLLRFSADTRAAAQLFWEKWLEDEEQSALHTELMGLQDLLTIFPDSEEADWLIERIVASLSDKTSSGAYPTLWDV